MSTENWQPHTIITLSYRPLADTFPTYITIIGFGMYVIYFLVTFYLGLIDPTTVLDTIIWVGTYITPYILHFWLTCAFFLFIGLFIKDYIIGYRQIKLELHQITFYPKQKRKPLNVIRWEFPIQKIFFSKEHKVPYLDNVNQVLILPAYMYTNAILQFYNIPYNKKQPTNTSKLKHED
ncbi:hypothetical protein [Aureispira sp. CCB-E]|uniref:hypothetical protein n=1 Tax=Aureispira sp. CCB-E TaxID=3051121 RepID=UPI002868EC78|nr:hypothetical protein [Aureispira sp. CCB-E]WMX16003.1 hypothetical protein QP953_06450 [Aureispira sp. CCB-E]